MVDESRSPISQVEWTKKQYTASDVKRDDCKSKFHHIIGQPVKWILHVFDNNILQNIPILREDVWVDEEIFGPSVPHLQLKTVCHKVQHVEHITVPNVPKGNLDR